MTIRSQIARWSCLLLMVFVFLLGYQLGLNDNHKSIAATEKPRPKEPQTSQIKIEIHRACIAEAGNDYNEYIRQHSSILVASGALVTPKHVFEEALQKKHLDISGCDWALTGPLPKT